jgi:CRISPR-associated endonuclease Cas2
LKAYVVAYDVFDPKRRYKVAKIVENHKLKGQKSSWETALDRKLMRTLLTELKEVLEEGDKVNLVRVVGKPILLGNAKSLTNQEGGIVIL